MKKHLAILYTGFDSTKIKILKREKNFAKIKILEGVLKGNTLNVDYKFIFPLKEKTNLHNKIYH